MDNDCDGAVDEADAIDPLAWHLDADEDGFGDPAHETTGCTAPEGYVAATDDSSALDCDDTDASVNPDATEICNGIDDDCDDEIDVDAEELSRWYLDVDEDGYGLSDDWVESCEAVTGRVLNSGDCDDTDGATHPTARETCNEADDDCDGDIDEDAIDALIWHQDFDEDGWGSTTSILDSCSEMTGYVSAEHDGDCDDTDAAIHPDADETCNEVDDNCDSLIDNDPIDGTTGYRDSDGDGYGLATEAVELCALTDEYSEDDNDCNDRDASIHPGADEICNEIDDDCNDLIDDEVIRGITFYRDSDGDEHGDADSPVIACSLPAGAVASHDDCNDTVASIHPGADEVCNEIDDDCDGTTDEDATDALSFYLDDDGDGWGNEADLVFDCSKPDGFVPARDAFDCDDTDIEVHPTADEYCNDIDDDCDELIDEEGAIDGDLYFLDADLDGYGGTDRSETFCGDPDARWSDSDDDCDDFDDDVSPSSEEVCNGYDDNCDGIIDIDSDCTCNVENFNGHSYLFCDHHEKKWSQAQSKCRANTNYDLVTINDADENIWVTDTAQDYDYWTGWWMGANDIGSEGTWTWSDGSSFSWDRWHSGEPNDVGGEDCGELNRWADDTWNDLDCNHQLTYICEATLED